ncbi:glypican-6-like [Limulus polyphemus]|uniref:Glypican-6-like n=1 Tax=Limulus polyphemus TaxID=6850 RepID=A0ABM1B1M3_LIMPO|nr:glypican-6-like [Limulus polyphemus]
MAKYQSQTPGQFKYALLTLVVCLICYRTSATTPNELACSYVKYAYSEKGFSDDDVPGEAIPGDHLRICDRSYTCCTEEMEHKLSTHSRVEFDKLLKDGIGSLKNKFASKTSKFDKFFQEMLDKSQKEFHEMFLRTYGMLYDRNSYIFKSMFQDLRSYYNSGGIDLSKALGAFFDTLYRKMFEVLNNQYTFSDSYLACISDHMEELKPFGDVPRKLTLELKRSFIATRTFVQALAVGRDVVREIMEVGPSPECSRALMKMSYCPHCKGLPDLKPCANYCLNVMKGCLAHHAELDPEWNAYIESLLMLASRLESSFNIEAVVDPIEIRISEAVMNFQENGPAVSKRLFEKCGKPRLGKREARKELEFKTYTFGSRHNFHRATKSGLDRLVDKIKKKIRRTKDFWSNLPNELCSNPKVTGDRNTRSNQEGCWNGLTKAKYDASLVGNGLVNQKDNPEVSLDVTTQNSVIARLKLTLQLITSKLNNAYRGVDVEWEDTSETEWAASGSGSGSGWMPEDTEDDSSPDIYFSYSTTRAPAAPRWPVESTEQPSEKPSAAPEMLSSNLLVILLAMLMSSVIYL